MNSTSPVNVDRVLTFLYKRGVPYFVHFTSVDNLKSILASGIIPRNKLDTDNIPYQCEIMSGSTGTNADVISLCESGIKGALISIPEKYMHQPCEVVDVNDIESVSNLIYAYISEKAGEPNA